MQATKPHSELLPHVAYVRMGRCYYYCTSWNRTTRLPTFPFRTEILRIGAESATQQPLGGVRWAILLVCGTGN